MPELRELRTWQDREAAKDTQKLSSKEREELSSELDLLFAELQVVQDIFQSKQLKRWRPSSYFVQGINKSDIQLVELRCKKLLRVVVWHCKPKDTIFLVSYTVTHDHQRLQRAIAGLRSELRDLRE